MPTTAAEKRPVGRSAAPAERRKRSRRAPGFATRRRTRKVEGLTHTELVVRYLPLVRNVAEAMLRKVPKSVDIDDLVSVGLMGLLDAAERYQSKHGAKFGTFAEFRIRGAMLDELRRLDPISRTARQKYRKVEKAVQKLEADEGRPLTHTEISQKLGMSAEELDATRSIARGQRTISIDDHPEIESKLSDPHNLDPFVRAAQAETQAFVGRLLTQLPEQERLVLALLYERGLNMREVGQIMELTESRISQIHAGALKRLREELSSPAAGARTSSAAIEDLFRLLLES